MTTNEMIAAALEQNLGMLKMTLADFSEADMLTRPCPSANHAAWQLGHLIVAETNLVGMVKADAHPALPAGFAEKFSKETCKGDEPKGFASKHELLDLFEKTRAGTVAWVKGMSAKDLDQPTPERIQRFATTAGGLAMMMPVHVAMHLGQFQVIRRKLNKPILF